MQSLHRNKKGLNLMEVILVVVIVGVTAALVAPNMRMGIENRQGKQATETLRSIFHAIRMYEADRGAPPDDLAALEAAGYLNSAEYAYKRTSSNTDSNGYQYSISGKCAQAEQYVIITTTYPCYQGNCREECSDRRRRCCGTVCDTICPPPTTTKKTIGTVQVCE